MCNNKCTTTTKTETSDINNELNYTVCIDTVNKCIMNSYSFIINKKCLYT